MCAKRVLLVEDDRIDQMKIHRLLQGSADEFEVSDAMTLRAAFDAVSAHQFDIGIFDLHLPDGDCLELLDELSTSSGSFMPVVVLTGLEDEATAQRALAHGAQGYLLKETISAPLLVRSMRYAVERFRAQALRRQVMHADRLKALAQPATPPGRRRGRPRRGARGGRPRRRAHPGGHQPAGQRGPRRQPDRQARAPHRRAHRPRRARGVHRGRGQRPRHPRHGRRANLRAVLHHQGAGRRHRTGARGVQSESSRPTAARSRSCAPAAAAR